MKRLFLIFLILPTLSFAQNWDDFETNIQLRSGDYGLEIRERQVNPHIELQYKGFAFRRAESEWRLKMTQRILSAGNFTLDGRLENRNYINPNKEDWTRFRLIGIYKPFGGNFWIKLQPRWNVDTQKISDWRNQFGYDIKLGSWRVTPFLDMVDPANKDAVFIGGLNVRYTFGG